jgi:hypothetical protein
MRFIPIVLPLLLAACAAAPVGPVDPARVAQGFGFLRSGHTTKQEVLERMGPPGATYERDRVLTYAVFENQLGRFDVGSTPRSAAPRGEYTLVLVFDERGILGKHSMVFKK